jgi:hypothetical protein
VARTAETSNGVQNYDLSARLPTFCRLNAVLHAFIDECGKMCQHWFIGLKSKKIVFFFVLHTVYRIFTH